MSELSARKITTGQRILDAALRVFASTSFERATVEEISAAAGCSKVTFYAHFNDKAHLFRELASQVARQLRAATEALEPLTPDAAGWRSLRVWVSRSADTYDRYHPVFRVFGAAVQTDPALGASSTEVTDRNVLTMHAKLADVDLGPRSTQRLLRLMIAGALRTFDIASFLRAAQPDAFNRDRTDTAVTDVLFRSLFGATAALEAPAPRVAAPKPLQFEPSFQRVLERANQIDREARRPDRRALAALLEVGSDIVVKTSLHGQGVDGLVAAAGVSHGAFYRYFSNRDDLVEMLAIRALLDLAGEIAAAPRSADIADLTSWLSGYARAHERSGPLVRLWLESGHSDPLGTDRATAFDWGRRHVRRVLASSDCGDHDAAAIVLLAVVEEFAALQQTRGDLEAALRVLCQGFALPIRHDNHVNSTKNHHHTRPRRSNNHAE